MEALTPHTVICLIALTAFLSCESKTPTPSAAFERERTERMTTVDSLPYPEDIEEMAANNESADEDTTRHYSWEWYLQQAETKLRLNERKIASLKANPAMTISLFKKLSLIEQDNMKIRLELSGFVPEDGDKNEKFGREAIDDLNEIAKALNKINARLSDIGTTKTNQLLN